jgi:hypothetical protein
VDPSALPQRTRGFGLNLRREVSVVDAGEDLVGNANRLGGMLGPAQYGQAAKAQVQPLRLSGAHVGKGECCEFPGVLGTGAGQGFRRGYQDQATAKVTGRRGRAGVGGSDHGLTEHVEVVVGQPAVQLTGTISGEHGADRLPDQIMAEGQGIRRDGDQSGLKGAGETVRAVAAAKAGKQRERVAYRQRPPGDRDQLHEFGCRAGKLGEPACHRRGEVARDGVAFAGCGRARQAVDDLSGQERIAAGGIQVAASPVVRHPPESVPRHRRQV